MPNNRLIFVVIMIFVFLPFSANSQEQSQEDLAKQAQNPIANMISLPFQYNASFETLVARVVAEYLDTRDPVLDRGVIAALGGRRIGSLFIVRGSLTPDNLLGISIEDNLKPDHGDHFSHQTLEFKQGLHFAFFRLG